MSSLVVVICDVRRAGVSPGTFALLICSDTSCSCRYRICLCCGEAVQYNDLINKHRHFCGTFVLTDVVAAVYYKPTPRRKKKTNKRKIETSRKKKQNTREETKRRKRRERKIYKQEEKPYRRKRNLQRNRILKKKESLYESEQ